jgi:hypothetical protein
LIWFIFGSVRRSEKMKSLKLTLIVLFGIAASLGCAQIFRDATFIAETGTRALSDTLKVRIVLQGGDTGNVVLGYADFDPPEPNGFPADRQSSIRVRFSRDINLRLVRRAMISIRADRAGGGITTGWDLKRIQLGPAGSRPFYDSGPITGLTLRASVPNYVTSNWPTYDPTGMNTPLRTLNLTVTTAGDDLRKDSAAGAVIVLSNGMTTRIDIGRGRGIPGRDTRSFPIVIPGGTMVNSVVRVYMFKSIYNGWTKFDYAHLTGFQKPTNADTWTVRAARLEGTLVDGSAVVKNLPTLSGDYTADLKSFVNNVTITPMPLAANWNYSNLRLGIIFDDTTLPFLNSESPAEVQAHVRYRGTSEWVPFAVRTSASTLYLNNGPAIWQGDGGKFKGYELGGSTKNCFMYADNPLWRGRPVQAIEAIKLSLHNGATSGDDSFGNYTGTKRVTVRGVVLGLVNARAVRDAAWSWSGMLTLGADLTRNTTLSQANPEVVYEVRHGIPETLSP